LVGIEETPQTQTSEPLPTPHFPLPSNEDNDLWFFTADDTAAQQQPAASAIKPRIINTPEQLSELVNLLQKFTNPQTPVAWDTETSDLEPRDASLVGMAAAGEQNQMKSLTYPLVTKLGII
jgi:DNA polymerase-1